MNEMQEESEYQEPSKSQLKREDTALQDLAKELAGLSTAQLSGLSLPEDIFDAVRATASMPPKGARKRQLKFIGGLLRNLDVDPLREELAALKSQSVHTAREHHKIEQWRDRLLAEDNQALTNLLNEYPSADRQQIRQLIRNAKKETETGKPPKSSRLIYRYLKELFEEND